MRKEKYSRLKMKKPVNICFDIFTGFWINAVGEGFEPPRGC